MNSGGLSTLMDDLVLGTLLIARCCSAPSRYFIYQNTSLYMVVSEIIPLCRPMSCLSDDVVYIYLGNGVGSIVSSNFNGYISGRGTVFSINLNATVKDI